MEDSKKKNKVSAHGAQVMATYGYLIKRLVILQKLLLSAQCAIQREKSMKLIAMIIVVLTMTSCSKTFEFDGFDPTTATVKWIMKGGKHDTK